MRNTMKAFGIVVFVIGFLWSTEVWAQGFDEVLVTTHNLSVGGPDSLIGDVCLVCHIKTISVSLSALESGLKPLWDSNHTTEFFLPIPQMESLHGKGEPGKRPFGPSFDCLTCHDGALGNDVHQRGISAGGGEVRKREVIAVKDEVRASDHPDSVVYPRSVTGAFTAHSANPNLKRYWSIPDRDSNGVIIPTGPKSASLGLMNIDPNNTFQTTGLVRTFFGMIHCDSCHNPHHNENKPFLRVPANDLCLICHQR